MTRTRLYLDFDGVLNANMPYAWGEHRDDKASDGRHIYKIRWAPALIDALRELDVDLVWTTTWRSAAVTDLSPLLGWGEHGRVLHPEGNEFAPTTFPSIYWKRDAVEDEQMLNPSPFIWIDDEIGPVEKQLAAGLGGLAIQTSPVLGITPIDMLEIRHYLQEHPHG